MCNLYRNRVSFAALRDAFIGLRTPGGAPNLEPRDEIRITETAPVVRQGGEGAPELVQLRWSWPGPARKPVYNFRSEGRHFPTGRCLIPADGFYEFTAAEAGAKRKTRWLFTLASEPWFCIAGLVRHDAWTMLTVEPGPDVAPYHSRQIVILDHARALKWLGSDAPEEALRPSPAGALQVERSSGRTGSAETS